MTSATSEEATSLVQQLKDKFEQLTMCEAQLEVLKKKYPLSDTISVSINKHAQIVFTITPEQDFMVPTEISISGPAWRALCNQVDKVKYWIVEVKNLKDKKEMVWMFHPFTKFVRVSYNDFGTMVSVLTMTRRGQEIKPHCIYLKQEEWEALTQCMGDISDSLNSMLNFKSTKTVKEMKTYKWKLLPTEDLQEEPFDPLPECKIAYLVEEHAAESGMQAQMDHKWAAEKMVVETEMKPPMEPMNLYMMVYFTILYHGCKVMNTLNCPGCRSGHPMGASTHRTFYGCKVFGRCLVGDNLKAVKLGITKDLVNDVFLKCWQALKLSMVEVDKLWENLLVLLPKDDVNDYLVSRVNHIGDNRLVIPEVLLIDDHVDKPQIKSAMYPHRHVEEESDSDSDSVLSPKRLKLNPDSDGE